MSSFYRPQPQTPGRNKELNPKLKPIRGATAPDVQRAPKQEESRLWRTGTVWLHLPCGSLSPRWWSSFLVGEFGFTSGLVGLVFGALGFRPSVLGLGLGAGFGSFSNSTCSTGDPKLLLSDAFWVPSRSFSCGSLAWGKDLGSLTPKSLTKP